MSRSERLLDLLHLLRQHRRPVSGQTLADALGVSLRTLYRDIATLQAQGADIDGEAGVGYVLRPGFLLPPMMFSEEEIEALALGCRWVMARTDSALADAARGLVCKVAAVLPPDVGVYLEGASLLVGAGREQPTRDQIDLVVLRRAIRQERKLAITYADAQAVASTRVVWPVGCGYFDQVRVLIAWCELRAAFRHFRTDRIQQWQVLPDRYPRRRRTLMKAWR
jgi:predicted DNA-binding transcriptional regulator YafY